MVGKPDSRRLELVKAYLVLREGAVASDAPSGALAASVNKRLPARANPREMAFVSKLSKNS